MSKLAIKGGNPVRTNLFPSYNVIGDGEISAVTDVMKSGILSRYLGAWHKDFFGGPKVQEFEANWSKLFDSKYSISMNSATSGLYAACAAAGFSPGDEVIVSPYTMSASAMAPVVCGANPVFADVDPETFCISADTIEARLTDRTKGIIVVHIFGGPANMEPIMKLAKSRGLVVIEDCAQSPMGEYKGKKLGTLGDIGIFSLNYHKHIHTGEGAVVVTQDDRFADRLMLIRNHAEAVVDAKSKDQNIEYNGDLVGFNYRLGEIEAAIGNSLIQKIDDLICSRIENVQYLESKISGSDCLSFLKVDSDNRHCYYVHPITYTSEVSGVHRNTFVAAIRAELAPCRLREAEGVLCSGGYVRPLYMQSFYQKRTHPVFKNASQVATESYQPGSAPNCEKAFRESLIIHELMRPGFSKDDLDDVVFAFEKVIENIDDLYGD
ncbi:DegT/DnrJ/EryC1/StrS family aminotransferase [Thalassospira lohafexi]|uniref:DegT/DnrJ/EryC1/StrS aminotransferase n=1 Tax=Thalassospira lohafexi TaxID=744227 RepID=A0A2N3LBD4_9PROT|nr:DegT/DnrJ/EryC1/StrS family aminotransferase [Thalassospira lohafexi]PKR60047.1 DegT/DnrJ/EryC1/StrS aminotransferase [Thalassospira lohafexi]